MTDVFISYKRGERSRVDRIAKKLQALGLDVWLDARIPSGTSFDTEIEVALKSTKVILVLWSTDSVASDWVRNEATVGKERGVLVALMLEPCELPLPFRSIQCEPLFDLKFADDDPSWVKAIERIKDLVGQRAQIERIQRRIISKRRVFGTMRWILVWPLGSAALLVILGFLFAPFERPRPASANFYSEDWDQGFFLGSGTLALENGRLVGQINHREISCNRETAMCVEAAANLNDWSGVPGEISALVGWFSIVQWDGSVIVARQQLACVEYVMTISRVSESITVLRQHNGNSSLCGAVGERAVLRIVDGAVRASRDSAHRGQFYIAAIIAVLSAWTLLVISSVVFVLRRK